MDVGVDSFVAVVTDPDTGAVVESAERMAHLLEEIELADRVGLASYGIGEHHRVEYYDAAPAVILAAAAARTSQIRLRSAVTVLSAADPVRVFQEFATVDLISGGRVELVVGRGSFTEAFPLFGLGVVFGAIWAEVAWGRFWGWDPKETVSFVTWIVYAGYLHARATSGWRNAAAAWINILGFATMVFNLFFINMVVSGLHSYAGLN